MAKDTAVEYKEEDVVRTYNDNDGNIVTGYYLSKVPEKRLAGWKWLEKASVTFNYNDDAWPDKGVCIDASNESDGDMLMYDHGAYLRAAIGDYVGINSEGDFFALSASQFRKIYSEIGAAEDLPEG